MRYSWLPLSFLIAASIAFASTAVGAAMSLDRLLDRHAGRIQALELRTDLQRLLTLLVDVETGQRGFIITGQRPFLRPYDEALGELGQLRADLRRRLVQGGAEPAALGRLDGLIDQRLAQARRVIEQRVAGDAVMRDLSAYVEGKRVMDDLRFEIEQLMREQQRRVESADRATLDVQTRTTQLARLLPPLGLAGLAVALAVMLRESRLRRRAETARQQAEADLEQRSAQRCEALAEALQHSRTFAGELERGMEAERRRLAREVHERIGVAATSIKMLAVSLRAKLPVGTEPLVDELQGKADEALRAARQLAAELRPPLLDEQGLEAALGQYLQGLQRRSGLGMTWALADAGMLAPEQADVAFRIVQQSCTLMLEQRVAQGLHVLGHGGRRGDREGYELKIVAHPGWPDGRPGERDGLHGMRERASTAGGLLDMGAAPEGGTQLQLWLPVEVRSP